MASAFTSLWLLPTNYNLTIITALALLMGGRSRSNSVEEIYSASSFFEPYGLLFLLICNHVIIKLR